jgi:hypothetical protein
MAQVPANPKLWNSLSRQAKAKYPSQRTKGLTFAAAKWLREEYQREGGSYVSSKTEVDPKARDYQQEKLDKIKRQKAEVKRKKKQQGFI